MFNKLDSPWRITLDTNPDLCNLHCIMCEEHSNYKKLNISTKPTNRIMSFSVIQNVIQEITEYNTKEIIPSTMGEPLLYPHFNKLLELIKKSNLKLNLTTNGTFPILGVEKWGYKILPIASDVKISINGATKEIAESIMNGIKFEKQRANIKKFINIRDEIRNLGLNCPTVTFQVTYMEKNIEELPELLKIAIELGIDRLKGHHLWITHAELKPESMRRNKDSTMRFNSIVRQLQEIADNSRLPTGEKIKLDNVYELNPINSYEFIPKDWICPFLGREAWIAWDGTFNVCCAPDELRKSLGSFGNVTNRSFMDIWNGELYNKLVRNWGNFEVCKKCNMRKPASDINVC